MQDIVLKLTPNDVQVVLAALGEVAAKFSHPVLSKIEGQLAAQAQVIEAQGNG